ncbi:bifunctional Vacuolar protein sorting-associated protein 13-like [Babesia duncani]|uniref:Bifunctional Vacuolar protein sorting-associated protein 13-like n=1 Tax=Babesia duncani TaxID=323732 RepID=A0AAD9PJS9_9APIC|nr:bifunctional Vacuolar protein sorting-associated protein 13-like [Babesia duncani]
MFEGLVKRLLETYLAPYVDGIKQNLQLAVWSGDIILENLTVKHNISAVLALPFTLLHGKIGKINIKIPWASIGTNPVKINVDSVYLCIKGRTDPRPDVELLAHIRAAKEKMIGMMEQELAEFASTLKSADVNSSYFIRLSQKILNNVQIDFSNIHLHFCGYRHAFGFIIDSIIVRKSINDESLNYLKVETDQDIQEEPITHVCSLLGFLIYESEDPSLLYHDEDSAKQGTLLFKDSCGGVSSSLSQQAVLSSSINVILSSLSFHILLAINPINKSIFSSLRIGGIDTANSEKLRVAVSIDSIRAFMILLNDLRFETERGDALLMEYAHTVAMDPDSMKGQTKAEYIGLYTKMQGYLLNGLERLTPSEEERLQVLTDVIPTRHLARWRFASNKLRGPSKEPQTTGTWFGWVRGLASQKFGESVTKEISSESLPGGLVLTEDEVKLIKDAMTLDEMFEDTMATSSYYLECILPKFQVVTCSGQERAESYDVISIEVDYFQSRLYLHGVIDYNDRDTYQGYFHINLDSIDLKFRDVVIMRFISDSGATKAADAVATCDFLPDSYAMNLRLVHQVTQKGNLMIVTGELKPIETHIIPAVISDFLELLLYIQPPSRPSFTNPSEPVHGSIEDGQASSPFHKLVMSSFLEEDMTEKLVYDAAAEHLPGLFAFDFKFAAPILRLYGNDGNKIHMHFGTLELKSNGACPLSSMSGSIKLKETQIACFDHDNPSWFDILKPLPVKIHYTCDMIKSNFNFDILFEEVFLTSTPKVMDILVSIPTELFKLLIDAKASFRHSEIKEEQVNEVTDVNRESNCCFSTNGIIRHSGFAVSNRDGVDVFKLEMYNVTLRQDLKPEMLSIEFGVEQILMSNPSIDVPLFFTNFAPVPTGRSERDDEFEDAMEETLKSLEFEFISKSGVRSINVKVVEMEVNWQYTSVKLIYEAINEYKEVFNNEMHSRKTSDSLLASATIQTFKQKLGMVESTKQQATGIGIADVNFGNVLPILFSEQSGSSPTTVINIEVNGAAITLCNNENEPLARLSITRISYNSSRYANGEACTDICIGTGKILLGGRCVLAHSVSEGDSGHLLSIRLKSYDSERLRVPYSMCVKGNMERIVFVYFSHDFRKMIDYLNDGIIGVFISKSYHKVVETVAATYMLYTFSISSPCFLIPENKSVLPNRKTTTEFEPMLPSLISGDASNDSIECGKVDTWYFGSYLLFELGHLHIRNGYTIRTQYPEPKSTLFVKMLGTRASIIEQKGGSQDVGGNVLDSTDVAVCFSSGQMLELGVDSYAWVLRLTRAQATFIIDVFNENICGSAYEVQLVQSSVAPTKRESRYNIRMSLARFQFDMSFGPTIPLSQFRFNFITVCLDYASDNVAMTTCYQFGLCGKTLTVDDERNSRNVHRRLLNCFVERDVNVVHQESNTQLEPSVNGLLQNWLRNFKLEIGHDFFSSASSSNYYGIKFVIVNENASTNVDVQVANAVISLLCMLALDVGKYFSAAYSCSTMSLYPRNLEQVNSVQTQYSINFKVANGKFIAFTQMDNTYFPQLELSCDFFLSMTIYAGNYNILNADIVGCQLARVYPVEKRHQVLCSNLCISGSGQYVKDGTILKIFLKFILPPCELTLYTKDLRIMLSAFGCLMTDGPSAVVFNSSETEVSDADTSSKFTSISLNVKGITITFYDDLRKSMIPMMRCTIAGEKLEYLNLPIEKRINIIKCSFKLYYFNAAIGDWEPCLERCNATLEYTANQGSDKRQRRKGRPNGDIWKDFVPQNVIKITSLHNILINITPSFCQLMLWFIPMLSDNFQKGLVYEPSSGLDTTIESSAYRYINLTGYEYFGFTLDTSCGNQNDAYSQLKVITTTNTVLELDTLVSHGSKRDACIYIVPRPPNVYVKMLCDEFGIKCTEPVLRDLLVTKSMASTRQNLRHCNPGTMSNSYSAPFENGTEAVVVPLARNCCVSLMTPLVDVPCSTEHVSPKGSLDHLEQVLCEVKTPHPSHKLLVFTSTVRIYNRCGVPLLLCFLDSKLKPIYMANLKTRCAPISILDQVPVNEEFTPVTALNINVDSNVSYEQMDAGYTMLLEPNSFASVPEWAFVGNAQAILSFTPLCLLTNNTLDVLKSDDHVKWSKLINTSGWSKMIDTMRHVGTRIRQCFSSKITDSQFLYFVVTVIKKKSPFPANVEMRDVVIYPSLSVMNTLPIELDIRVTAKGYTSPCASPTRSDSGNTVQQLVTLSRRSIMHIYSVPPNESLTLASRIAHSDYSVWSERVSKIYGTTETHTTLELPMKNMAPIELELIRCPGGLPICSNTFQGHLSVIVNAPWWFIDRSGLQISPVRRHHRQIFKRLTFLSTEDENHPVQLAINGKIQDSKLASLVRLPAVGGYSYALVEEGSRKHAICLTTEKVYISGLSSLVSCRITCAMPEYLLTNNLQQDIYIRKDSRVQPIKVTSSTSIAIPWINFKQVANEMATTAFFEFKPDDDSHWSSSISLSEAFSGTNYMCIRQEHSSRPLTFRISIVPKKGTKYCSISVPESTSEGYTLINSCPHIKAAMVRTFHQGDNVEDNLKGTFFTAKYGQVVHFGWPEPFLHKSRLCQVLLWLDKTVVAPSKPLIINIGSPAFRYRQVEVSTPECTKVPTLLVSAENRGDYVAIEVKPAQNYGIAPALSDTDDKFSEFPAEDLATMNEADSSILDTEVYDTRSFQIVAQLSEIGLSLVSHKLHQELFFMEISGVSFVGLCKNDHQRLELRISDLQIDDQVPKENESTASTILVNRGKVAQDQQRHFLQVYIDRPFASCKDLCLKKVFIALDDVEIDLTDALMDCIYDFYKECLRSLGSHLAQKVDLELIDQWMFKETQKMLSSLDTDIAPPRALVLDYLFIEKFNLVLWCSFELDKLHMLGDLMRMGLRILCVSRHFELMGAPLQFQQEYFCNSRSTISSFYEQLKDKYLHSALGCIGSLLGYSSLLNIPKLPITVGRNTIEFAANAVDSVSSGLGSLIYMFTFDNEYINKRQRDRLTKPCSNMKEGILSAGKSIGEGFMSLTNIVTKPIEGAQKEGMGGFIKGLGKGLAGSIVKPIDKVGQAVSHFSRGIKANMSKPLLYDRWAVEPCRKPRMLWGEYSQVKPYNLADAEIKKLLGTKLIKNIKHCETVAKQASCHLVILFYPSKVYYVDLAKPKPVPIWKVHVSEIEETRASSLGIIIKTKDKHYQLPCTNSSLIYTIFTALENARKEACSTVVIGPELFSLQSY